MSMSANTVDIDSETILFEGRWLGREELARNIKLLLDGGNYNIGRQSAALEALNAALSDVRTVAFRASPQLAQSLSDVALKSSRTLGAVIRDALAQYLSASKAELPPVPLEPRKEPTGRRQTEPELPAVVLEPGMTQAASSAEGAAASAPSLSPEPRTPPAPPPGLKPASALIAGPGALKSAGVTAAHPGAAADAMATPSGAHLVTTEPVSAEEAAGAVDLKPKLKEGETPDAVERRWFGG